MKRFFDKIIKSDGCWTWNASLRSKGYGAFKFKGKVVLAHRFSWIFHNGDIPDGLSVCHKCDNPICVNPNHLFLGTHSDNMKDAFNKKRLNINFNNPGAFKNGHIPNNRLIKSFEEIQNIKKLITTRSGTLKELSKEINISYQLLRDINCGKVYK